MTTSLVSKFSIGDVVYKCEVIPDDSLLPCDDCVGTAQWSVVIPGEPEELVIRCPTCQSSGTPGRRDKYNAYVGSVVPLTIGLSAKDFVRTTDKLFRNNEKEDAMQLTDKSISLTPLSSGYIVSHRDQSHAFTTAEEAMKFVGASLEGAEGYTLRLVDVGNYKIQMIKAVRTVFGLDLRTAKAAVEAAPCSLLVGATLDQTKELSQIIEDESRGRAVYNVRPTVKTDERAF